MRGPTASDAPPCCQALKPRDVYGEDVLMLGLRLALAAIAGFFLVVPLVVGDPAAGDSSATGAALEQEWSTRLLQQQARIERAQQRLDEHNGAYAKAVAGRERANRIRALQSERASAAAKLLELQKALPKLLAEARADGIGEDILRPYRYALSPTDLR